MTEIGSKIKAQRRALGMTQEELGTKLGVTKATINKYETGIVTNFTRPRIEELSKALEVSPAYLLGWDNLPEAAQEAALEKLSSYNMSETRPERLKRIMSRVDEINAMYEREHNQRTALSKEEQELLRIYNKISVRGRMKLLQSAIDIEDIEDGGDNS